MEYHKSPLEALKQSLQNNGQFDQGVLLTYETGHFNADGTRAKATILVTPQDLNNYERRETGGGRPIWDTLGVLDAQQLKQAATLVKRNTVEVLPYTEKP